MILAAATGIPWAVIGPTVLTAIATLAVGVYTARSARAANRETSQLTGWQVMTKAHQEEIDRLRSDREEDRQRYISQITECNTKIDALTARFGEVERRERALSAWARQVIELMRSAGLAFPEPPIELTDQPRG